MFKSKASTPAPTTKKELTPTMQVLRSYKKATDKVYYKEVSLKNLGEIKKELNYEIPLLKKSGLSAILVDGKLRKEYLSPGLDPYQVRKDFEEAIERENIKRIKAENAKKEESKIDTKKSSSSKSKKSS